LHKSEEQKRHISEQQQQPVHSVEHEMQHVLHDTCYVLRLCRYMGHSWASGLQNGPEGKNQESTSEAVNGYLAIAMLGRATGGLRLALHRHHHYVANAIAAVQQCLFLTF
jgi:hypothetical protein